MNCSYDRMMELVAANLQGTRLLHTLGVVQSAVALAAIHGVDARKAATAAFLHDCAKAMDRGGLEALLASRPGSVDGEDLAFPQVLHANAAAVIARERCGVVDAEILDAIRHHPTGRANPSPVMLVLLAADYTDPTRDFEGVESLRSLVRTDLRAGVREILRRKVEHVRTTGRATHPRTQAALDSLQE